MYLLWLSRATCMKDNNAAARDKLHKCGVVPVDHAAGALPKVKYMEISPRDVPLMGGKYFEIFQKKNNASDEVRTRGGLDCSSTSYPLISPHEDRIPTSNLSILSCPSSSNNACSNCFCFSQTIFSHPKQVHTPPSNTFQRSFLLSHFTRRTMCRSVSSCALSWP